MEGTASIPCVTACTASTRRKAKTHLVTSIIPLGALAKEIAEFLLQQSKYSTDIVPPVLEAEGLGVDELSAFAMESVEDCVWRESTASRSASTGCNGTSSRRASRWKLGREVNRRMSLPRWPSSRGSWRAGIFRTAPGLAKRKEEGEG